MNTSPDLQPYRVEARGGLSDQWMRVGEHGSHDDARRSAAAYVKKWPAVYEARVIVQHVIERVRR